MQNRRSRAAEAIQLSSFP